MKSPAVTTSTITPDMLRQQRDDAIAHPERYPNYRDAVIRHATWALGETADVAGVDCSMLGVVNAENYRQISLERSVETWNWRAAEDAKTAAPTDLDVVLRNIRNGNYLQEQLPPAIVKLIERVRELEDALQRFGDDELYGEQIATILARGVTL